MDDLNTFGGRFRAFRKSRKLKGEEMGEIMGVLKTQVSMIECNKTMPHLEKVIELALRFPNLNLEWLLKGRGDMLIREGQDKVDYWPLLQEEKEKLKEEQEKLKVEQEKLELVREKLQEEREKTEMLEGLLSRHGIKTR